MLGGQPGDEPAHVTQGQSRVGGTLAVGSNQRVGIDGVASPAPDGCVPLPTDPHAVRDLEHPAMEVGARLPLQMPLNGTFIDRLDQIVGLIQ